MCSGNTLSCGCEKRSRGENKISQILTEAKIPFKTEYIFEDCINPKTGKKLRFDFFVDNKYVIEYDGIQHSISSPGVGWGEDFEQIQFRDKLKNEYCQNHNIPIIRIPYTKYDTLVLEDLLLNS